MQTPIIFVREIYIYLILNDLREKTHQHTHTQSIFRALFRAKTLEQEFSARIKKTKNQILESWCRSKKYANLKNWYATPCILCILAYLLAYLQASKS